MTDTTLEDRVVAFITERGGGVSFVELEREFPEEFEGQEHALNLTDYDNIMLWQPVSLAMAGALNTASTNGRIVIESAPQIVYLVDGKVPMMPIARKARQVQDGPVAPGYLQPRTARDHKGRCRVIR